MAFSTFRFFMAAAGSGSVPPTFSDVFSAEIPIAPHTGFTPGVGNAYPIAGNSSNFYITYTDQTNVYASIISHNTSYSIESGQLVVEAIAPAANNMFGASVDSTHFIVTYPDNAGATIRAAYITNTAGTLSVTTGPTSISTVTGARLGSPAVLDSSNVLSFNGSTSSANNTLTLFNPTTLAVIQNSSASSINMSGGSFNFKFISVSATLACIVWNSTSNVIQISTVDVVSGTSFTLNAAVSSGVTITSGSASIVKVSSSLILLVYRKNATTLAARTVTLGAGGSVTYNTEYTLTVATTISTSVPPIAVALYGSNYVTGYTNSSNLQRYVVSMQLAGNVVTFSNNNPVLITSNNAAAGNNTIAHEFVPIDSSHVGMVYQNGINSGNGRAFYASWIDLNNSTPTWGTWSGNKNGPFTAANMGSTGLIKRSTGLYIGGNRFLYVGNSTGSDTKGFLFDSYGGTDNTGMNNAEYDFTGSINANISISRISYSPTNGVARALVAWFTSSATMNWRLIGWSASGVMSVSASSTATITGINDNPGEYYMMQLGAENALFVNRNSSTNEYWCNVITSTTDGITIASTGTNASVISIASESPINSGLQFYPINTTQVLVAFITQNTSTSKYSLKMCVLTNSAGTVTAGTIVDVYTGYTNNVKGHGVSVFSAGTSGIVTYFNDNATSGSSLLSSGFTISGTTITLGTQNTLVTGVAYGGKTGNGGYQQVAVSPTEVLYGYYNLTNTRMEARLLTYANVNSVTTGSAVNLTTSPSTQLFLLPGENGNSAWAFADKASDINLWQLYRG